MFCNVSKVKESHILYNPPLSKLTVLSAPQIDTVVPLHMNSNFNKLHAQNRIDQFLGLLSAVMMLESSIIWSGLSSLALAATDIPILHFDHIVFFMRARLRMQSLTVTIAYCLYSDIVHTKEGIVFHYRAYWSS